MAPAIEHLFSEEPLPAAVVLDADFVVSVLHEGEEFHADCLRFATRLFEEGVPIIYCQLLRLEFLSGWQAAIKRRGIPLDLMREARRSQRSRPDHERLYRLGDRYLASFLQMFDRYEVRLSARLQDLARRFMAEYGLKPMDACLVASAVRAGVSDIASLDRDFRPVDDIHLWNDHIPTRRRAARRQ